MPTSHTTKVLIADGTSRAEGDREETRHFDFNSSSSSSLSPQAWKNTQQQNVTSEVLTGRLPKLSTPFMSLYSNGHSSSKVKKKVEEEEEDLSILTSSSSILLQLRRNQQERTALLQREGTGIHSSPFFHDAIDTTVSDLMENMDNSTNSAAEVKNYVNNNNHNKLSPTPLHFNFTRENFLHDGLVASTNDNLPSSTTMNQYQYQEYQHQLFNNPYSHAGSRSSERMTSAPGLSSYPSYLGGFRNQAHDHDTVNDFYQGDPQHMIQNQQNNLSSSFLSRPQEQQEMLEWGEAHPRSNLYKRMSSMNMIHHSNEVPYSQMYHPHRISFVDGMSLNHFQISNESIIHPDSSEEHPFHPSTRSDWSNLVAVSTEVHHSSDHTRKTFSLQKIYRALNRHLRGVGNEEDNKPKKENILGGIRREGSLSDNHRSIIKPSSRKRSNEESNESTTEISSTTKSSSLQSSYRERIIPSGILRADSNSSYAQSNHLVYPLNPSNLKKDPYSTTITNHHHHVTHRYCVPIMMGVSTDADHISEFLQFLRAECCQVFTAGPDEVNERRTSKPVHLHQVGIRCAFCAHTPYSERAPRSSCYPSGFNRIYQSVVMMVRDHFSVCPEFPPEVREKYVSIKACSRRRRDIDSRQYWAISAKSLGIVETDMGLFFQTP